MSRDVRVLVLTGYGLNCDLETAHAFTLAGADARRVHINDLIRGEASLADYQILVFGGGFGWGDDHGAGVVQAVRMRTHLGGQIRDFVADGRLVIGICNGFQTLVNLGLLPGLDGDYQARTVALMANDCGNFRDQWVRLIVNADSPCVFTRGLDPGTLDLPVRHGEGRFYADPEILKQLLDANQIVLRYAGPDGQPAGGRFPDNPNGSMMDIAGICDPTGRVFGLMPHPEAYNHPTNHPDWPRQREALKRQGRAMSKTDAPGVRLFRNAVVHVRGH